MSELFSGLTPQVIVTLIFSLGFVLTFEFINGFHDTANAVATVIYTQSMKPRFAVFISGIFNFVGVLSGGLAVAYAIVHLLPVDLLVSINTTRGLSMVFALLAAAIAWNLGTWYFGLPASSSHTLIGAILGVGVANSMINHVPLSQGINFTKAFQVGLSLLCSPLLGCLIAGVIVLALRYLYPISNIHKTPLQRHQMEGKKHPPFWTRFLLVISAMGVSFAHGSNDGQKGVGLIMLVLIGIVPTHYVLNLDSNQYHLERTRDAAVHLKQFYLRHQRELNALIPHPPIHNANNRFECKLHHTPGTVDTLMTKLTGIDSYHSLPPNQRWEIRVHLLCLDEAAKLASRLNDLSTPEQEHLLNLRDDLTATTEYAPTWVILSVALALGIGTMIGWKRVAKTVGEGIGKKDMTYAQGMAAQMTAGLSIGFASIFGMPVSTTQVLSSAVAGSMIADRAGIQLGTVRAILLAWIFTLPISMLLSASLYYFSTLWIG